MVDLVVGPQSYHNLPALEAKAPYVVVTAAGGARMQEGMISLMQMPRTTVAVQMLKEANLPYVVVLTHPTTGGVFASWGSLGHLTFAEPGALVRNSATRSAGSPRQTSPRSPPPGPVHHPRVPHRHRGPVPRGISWAPGSPT